MPDHAAYGIFAKPFRERAGSDVIAIIHYKAILYGTSIRGADDYAAVIIIGKKVDNCDDNL